MTISVVISIPGQTNEHVVCSDQALALPRLAFNPSGDANVTRIKALVAALTQVIIDVGMTVPGAADTASEALLMLRTASMTAVYAATTPQEKT